MIIRQQVKRSTNGGDYPGGEEERGLKTVLGFVGFQPQLATDL